MLQRLGRLGLLGIFLALLSLGVFASAEFDSELVAVTNHIDINESARYNLTIINNGEETREFRIRNFDYPVWDVRTEPFANPIIVKVEAGGSETIPLLLQSLQPRNTPVGTYSINLRVEVEDGFEALLVPMTVAIKSTDALISGYLPNVETGILVSKEVDPREPFSFKVSLRNHNPIDYEAVTVKVRSAFINEEKTVSLGPSGDGTIENPDAERAVEFVGDLDSLTHPQEDTVYADVFFNDRKIDSAVTKFDIVSYSSKEEETVEDRLLQRERRVVVTSNDPGYSETISLETGWFRKLFTKAVPRAEIVKDGKTYIYSWDVVLNEEGIAEVRLVENFRPLVVLFIFGIVVIALYFTLRSPIVVQKEARAVRRSQGGASRIKVLIKVRNRGNKKIGTLEIKDTLPSIGELEKEIDVGSIKPEKVVRHKHNIVVTWKLKDIEARDERVISYEFKSRLPIVGDYSLAGAQARCTIRRRHIVTNSNRASLN